MKQFIYNFDLSQIYALVKILDYYIAIFKGIYISFAAMKIIVLDGCFFKNFVIGELPVVIMRDGNSHMFPIASTIIYVEFIDTWKLFIRLLRKDFNVDTSFCYTLMADQQKVFKC